MTVTMSRVFSLFSLTMQMVLSGFSREAGTFTSSFAGFPFKKILQNMPFIRDMDDTSASRVSDKIRTARKILPDSGSYFMTRFTEAGKFVKTIPVIDSTRQSMSFKLDAAFAWVALRPNSRMKRTAGSKQVVFPVEKG